VNTALARTSPAAATAIAGTVLIAAGAFWLSFTALADLAKRSGISPRQAWAWPLIVDGVIVVSTVAVVATSADPSRRSAWYPWLLLFAGAGVSVTANALHAAITADSDVARPVAAAVAAVPPMVLLAITHLTVQLTRLARAEATRPAPVPASQAPPPVGVVVADTDAPHEITAAVDRRVAAAGLREEGLSNRAIAARLGVHPSTVSRWLPAPGHGEAGR